MPPKTQKKKLKTRMASKKDTTDLVQTVVKVLRTAEKKKAASNQSQVDLHTADSVAALRRDMQKMQELFDDRLNRIEDKVSSLRVFADDTRRSISEQSKNLDDRLDQMARAVNDSLEKESKKNIKLVKTVYKEHGEEISDMKEAIRGVRQDALDKAQLVDTDVQFLAKDLSRIKEAVDELSIKRLGYIPASKSELSSRQLDTNAGLTIERMNQKMRQLERKVGDAAVSPSRHRDLGRHGRGSSPDAASDKMVGKLLLRVESCERKLDSIAYSSNDGRNTSPQVSHLELKSNLKALGKNTSRAFKSLSAGLEDVQQATLLLYDWADKVHNSFETVSYKLEYPTNICPRLQVSMRRAARKEDDMHHQTFSAADDFVFTNV